MTAPHLVTDAVTCLGCGCACDDITVTAEGGRIVALDRACELGARWFGDGLVPAGVTVRGTAAPLDRAVGAAAALLATARGHALVYLAPDTSTEVQREAIAIADRLRAAVDSATSSAAAAGILAAQRRGRAAATLGEIRNRADAIVCWGVDPAERHPRFLSRYAMAPEGTHVEGRSRRRLVAVTVGDGRGPANADERIELTAAQEVEALGVMRAVVAGNIMPDALSGPLRAAARLAHALASVRYVAIVYDGEGNGPASNPYRAEALIALVQALNGPTRAVLIGLRAGGNRSGAEAALTWQTGFPFAVDFGTGVPRFAPDARGATRAAHGAFRAALVVGATATIADELAGLVGRVPVVAIGPRATEGRLRPEIAIDTGIAGIHDGGTAYRMDDVPLPLRPSLPTPRPALEVIRALRGAIEDARAGEVRVGTPLGAGAR